MPGAPGKRALAVLALLLAIAGCGPEGDEGFSPSAHCQRRCEILFECVGQPTGPSDRDREEFDECVGSCRNDLDRSCEQERAFECTDCWTRRTCDEVLTGWCEPICTGACEG